MALWGCSPAASGMSEFTWFVVFQTSSFWSSTNSPEIHEWVTSHPLVKHEASGMSGGGEQGQGTSREERACGAGEGPRRGEHPRCPVAP